MFGVLLGLWPLILMAQISRLPGRQSARLPLPDIMRLASVKVSARIGSVSVLRKLLPVGMKVVPMAWLLSAGKSSA